MEILNQFGINPILLAAQVVNFLILLFILKKFLYKPILKALDARKQKIEDSLRQAEEIEKRLQVTEEEKEKILAKALVESQKIIDNAKKEIDLMKAEARAEAEKVALGIIKQGEEYTKAEMEKMKQELMSNLAGIVAVGMEKVTGKVLNEKRQREIIEKEVNNLS